MKTSNEVPALFDKFSGEAHDAFSYSIDDLIAMVPIAKQREDSYSLGAILHYLKARCNHTQYQDVLYENGMKSRMANYIMAIYVKFHALQLPCPVDIPWRTLGEGVRLIDSTNYKEEIEFCRKSTAEEVRERIRELRGQ